ncbi:hypothetical protein A33Q_3543 [Indibacter alkaliphilus LW1]|uniref:Uncharacterized protein n=1 Tax=Indibacter alkaliphilus (strain CCUG 57479 / KCTC 22604 / LW1) TaxID=1189612 RepID=S2D2S8_INDAL|nr:hypothetical protein [Indibacter alkaliphilus]EOZ93597.1 hypothetical protein A33Q_3543 [Indibacter alkaliphilus LW1]
MPIDTTPAEFSFLPWLRYGLGNEITEEDSLGAELGSNPVMDRPEVIVSFEIEASKSGQKGATNPENKISKTVKIQGPGDVLGIDPKMVIRTHPKKGVDNFEIENLAYVEFYEEDLPWRFTPAKPNSNKIRPWMSLIVLKESEFEIIAHGNESLPYLRINSDVDLSAVFCHEKDTWAFAHVHVFDKLTQTNPSATQLQAQIQKSPDSAIARIICPRRLDEDKEYQAFIIPTFETGRLAGLKQSTADIPAQKSSWNSSLFSGSHPREYPFYFQWKFSTGPEGAFETLAGKLEVLGSEGIAPVREADIRELGYDIDASEFPTIQIEGALKTPGFQIPSWPNGGSISSRNDLLDKVERIINLNEALQDESNEQLLGEVEKSFFYTQDFVEDPIITPPLYGKWHSLKNKANKALKDWVDEVNLHPSYRSAAGLGTRVVMKYQEYFMELAWEQIGQINEANQKIMENELMRTTALATYNKSYRKMSEMSLLSMSANAMKQIKVEKTATFSAAQNLINSKIPDSLSSGNFIKVANNFTPTAVMSSDGTDGAHKVLSNQTLIRANLVGSSETFTPITPAPLKKEPNIAVSPKLVMSSLSFILENPPKSEIEQIADEIAEHFNQSGSNQSLAGVKSMLFGKFGNEADARTTKIINGITKVNKLETSKQTSLLFNFVTWDTGNAPAPPPIIAEIHIKKDAFQDYVSKTYNEAEFSNIRFISEAVSSGNEIKFFSRFLVIQEQKSFVKTFENFLGKVGGIDGVSFTPLVLAPLQIDDFSKNLKARMLPRSNFLRKLQTGIKGKNVNLEKPIMAYPRFPIPTYNYLEEISQDFIIPNISEVPKDSILLMEVNHKFIESFLLGMNHEMSRELLWREFPTDLRGSYFRHFWEYDNNPFAIIDENLPPEEFMEQLKDFQDSNADIQELHRWKSGSSLKKLGQNGRNGLGLVLLVKGDLFKKYPNTLVYAQRGVNQGNQTILSDYNSSNASWPVIKGHLEPDIYFFGFELTVSQVSQGAGHFFVFREIPGQISFGLDAYEAGTSLNTWNDLNWAHMGTNPKQVKIFNNPKSLTPSTPAGEPKWNKDSNAADIASILYQSPILFAKHASNLLT